MLMVGCHGQVLEGSTKVYRYIGRDQILVQGHVDAGVQKADRQPEDEPQSIDPLPVTFRIEHLRSADQRLCRVSTFLQTIASNPSPA